MRNHGKFGSTLALVLIILAIGSSKAEAQFRPQISINASASVGVGGGYGNARNWYGNEWMYGNTRGLGSGYGWGNNLTGPRHTADRGDYVEVPNGIPGQSDWYYVPGSALQNRPGINASLHGQGFGNYGYINPGNEYLAGGYMHPPMLPNCYSAAGGYWNSSPFAARFCGALATQSFVARFGSGLRPVAQFAAWGQADYAQWGEAFVRSQYEVPPPIRADTNGFTYDQVVWARTVNNPPMPTLPVSQPSGGTGTQSASSMQNPTPITTGSSIEELKAAFKRQVKKFDERLCALEKNCDEDEK